MDTPCHSFQWRRHNQAVTGGPLPNCNMQRIADTSSRPSELRFIRGVDPPVLCKMPSAKSPTMQHAQNPAPGRQESPTIQSSMVFAAYSTLMQHAHNSACSLQLPLILKVLFVGCTRIAPLCEQVGKAPSVQGVSQPAVHCARICQVLSPSENSPAMQTSA